jgi:two-component system, OmpR family, sensor kinase
VLRRLSLRSRLILGVIFLTLVGLAAADIATYSSLQSFLVQRTDKSLDDAHHVVDAGLHRPHGGAAPSEAGVPGYYVQIRRPNGTVVVSAFDSRFGGDDDDPPPNLPESVNLHESDQAAPGQDERVAYFTTSADDGDHYRVRAWTQSDSPYTFFVAAPLKDVDSTLHRLLLIELLVTGLVLAGIAALGLWVVRLGLRPLAAIGATASRIADGDLTQRVARTDERTEVGRLGLALNAMLGQIESGFRAKEASERKLRRFVADASHELRTPLAAVRAYAELFTRGAAERPADLERSMAGIARESERMSLLVDDLLLLARLDEGRPLEQKPVRLDELVHEAVDAAHAVDPDRRVDVVLAEAVVVGDGNRLRQVVDNLLANARAHTPPGTPVHVTLETAVDAGESRAVLTVRDEGPGLDAAHGERIFQRFYRSDESRSRASGGVGLGLAIVAAVAEAHGGRASVESEPGHGAAFRVELPLADP